MKNFLILIGIIFSFSTLEASEVSEWFEKESNQFLEIINNNEGTENENYEKYKYFINKNFAVKSIYYQNRNAQLEEEYIQNLPVPKIYIE